MTLVRIHVGRNKTFSPSVQVPGKQGAVMVLPITVTWFTKEENSVLGAAVDVNVRTAFWRGKGSMPFLQALAQASTVCRFSPKTPW